MAFETGPESCAIENACAAAPIADFGSGTMASFRACERPADAAGTRAVAANTAPSRTFFIRLKLPRVGTALAHVGRDLVRAPLDELDRAVLGVPVADGEQ